MNNVAIDVINFANPDNVPKLEALVNSANQGDNCNFLNVPLGITVLTDVLFTSPILAGDMAAGMGAGAVVADGSGGMVMDQMAGGVPGMNPTDYNLDPELAEAIRLSMQEDQAR